MKRSDFDKILFDALQEFSLSDFFETTRADRKIRKDEFVSGLKLSYKDLFSYVDALYKEEEKSEKDDDFGPSVFNFVYPLDFDSEVSHTPKFTLPSNEFLFVDREVMAKLKNGINEYSNDIEEDGVNKSESNSDLFFQLLNKYFEGIDLAEFTNIVRLHRCGKQYKWICKRKAEAVRFMKHFKMSYEEMNKCFIFPDGKKLYSGNEKGISLRPSVGINKILKQSNKK